MTPVRWLNLIDFLVLTLALYGVLSWARQARAMRLAFWIVGLYAASLVARRFDLIITSWVLDAATVGLIVMLLIMFQPELRRAFLSLDRILRVSPRSSAALEPAFHALADAAFSLAHDRVGALIVIVRDDPISEIVEDGVPVGAEISRPLLEAIFQKTSPVHDGAALLESGRISRVNVILPLSHRPDVPLQFGTRHRAAMGIAERSDAIVIVASEERGEVSLMRGRSWQMLPGAPELLEHLQRLRSEQELHWSEHAWRLLVHNLRLKLAAAGLGILIFALSLFSTGTTIRTVTVGVELVNLPRGLDVAEYSARKLEVSLRGRSWLMDTTNPDDLVARFDLRNAHEGVITLRPTERDLGLPPGVRLDGVVPPVLSVRIRKRE
ncbi:MAG: diadenylate cyclase [Bryobacteraceae bacterium]